MSRQSELAALGRVADTGALSNRRLTYNGAMTVWQRGTSADTASNGDYMCDRWRVAHSGLDGNVDWDQETSSTPDGFGYALKMSIDASETSLDAADYIVVQQRFEGQDLQHLQKGTSNAKKLALSFWVRSSVASTYTVELEDDDNSRLIGKSYTIDTADTWEYKTVVFEGDTSGAFTNDANLSLRLNFWLDAGTDFTSGTFSTAWQASDADERVYDTTGWLESTSPTFYITGVQLEVNTVTDFEHRSFGQELALCKRYYEELGKSGVSFERFGVGWTSPSVASFFIEFEVEKRASPSVSISDVGHFYVYTHSGNKTGTSATQVDLTPRGYNQNIAGISSTAGDGALLIRDGSDAARIYVDAEL